MAKLSYKGRQKGANQEVKTEETNKPKRQVSVRLSDDEFVTLSTSAENLGCTVATYLRIAGLKQSRQDKQTEQTK